MKQDLTGWMPFLLSSSASSVSALKGEVVSVEETLAPDLQMLRRLANLFYEPPAKCCGNVEPINLWGRFQLNIPDTPNSCHGKLNYAKQGNSPTGPQPDLICQLTPETQSFCFMPAVQHWYPVVFYSMSGFFCFISFSLVYNVA